MRQWIAFFLLVLLALPGVARSEGTEPSRPNAVATYESPAPETGRGDAPSQAKRDLLDTSEDAGTLSGQFQFCGVAGLKFKENFLNYLNRSGVSAERISVYTAVFDNSEKAVVQKMRLADTTGKRSQCSRQWTGELRRARNEYLRRFAAPPPLSGSPVSDRAPAEKPS